MPTIKLFHEDAYRTEFTGRVLSCSPNGSNWDVILDRTCFYAEAGGQPSDAGVLGGQPVLGVREEDDGTVIHTVPGSLAGEVVGQIDWNRRLDHMEQHTGQHLLSGVFERLLDADTVSWHLGSESCTVDLSAEGLLPEQVDRVEQECNRVLRSCLPVLTHVVDSEGVRRFHLRKPPTVSENIRVVEIAGYDWSGCAGTHVRNIGELGLLKVKSWERYKKTTRVEFLVGQRALNDYINLDSMTRYLSRSLTMAVAELPKYAERTQEEIASLRKLLRVYQDKALEMEARDLIASARSIAAVRLVCTTFGGRPVDELKMLAAKVAQSPSTIAVFGTRGAVPQLVIHRSVDVRVDAGSIMRQALPVIEGKGGGSPIQAQGGGSRPERLEAALDLIVQRIAEAVAAL